MSRRPQPERWELRGVIASAGFASGDRIVVGHWDDSPLGAFADVMWAQPDGTRVLLAPHQGAADFVTALYRFDRVEICPLSVAGDGSWLEVGAADLEMQLKAGKGVRFPMPSRPAWFTRWVEGPIAARLLGVHTYGETDRGVREWYRADTFRPVRQGWATIRGEDAGPLAPLAPACGFNFSEPPNHPSMVAVRPLLEDPSGRLGDVVRAAARALVSEG